MQLGGREIKLGLQLLLATMVLSACVASGQYNEWATESQANARAVFGVSHAGRCDKALRAAGKGGNREGDYQQLTTQETFVVLKNISGKVARLGYDPLVNSGKPKHAYLVAFAAKFKPDSRGIHTDKAQGCLFDAQSRNLKLVSTLTRSNLSVRY